MHIRSSTTFTLTLCCSCFLFFGWGFEVRILAIRLAIPRQFLAIRAIFRQFGLGQGRKMRGFRQFAPPTVFNYKFRGGEDCAPGRHPGPILEFYQTPKTISNLSRPPTSGPGPPSSRPPPSPDLPLSPPLKFSKLRMHSPPSDSDRGGFSL